MGEECAAFYYMREAILMRLTTVPTAIWWRMAMHVGKSTHQINLVHQTKTGRGGGEDISYKSDDIVTNSPISHRVKSVHH